jgi:uroporphyrin-III C-methyltransferase/precorrin-2 dehydrogenase/sirohydrochlorin ferrochelatase
MDVLPLFVRVRDRACLVVGGGAVAAGKVSVLLKAGARVHVVSPEVGQTIERWATDGALRLTPSRFESAQLDGQWLVIAATNDAELNTRIVDEAMSRGMLANAASDGAVGDFIMPAIIDRSPVIAAVSTSGSSPALARFIRSRIESLLPQRFGHLGSLAREFRRKVKDRLRTPAERRAFWDGVFNGPIAEHVFAGRDEAAREALEASLAEPSAPRGEVFLVGAGPGDPELLSFRAMRLIQQADVVVYDRLVTPEILELVRRDAEKIYVGKKRADHSMAQAGINQTLVSLAREGKRVLRLKGGDPFIFGRGGEEIEELAREGIPFQVVPGITAASGCAAYAGIPLTHRDHAKSCIFVTGNLANGTLDLDWAALARPMQTIVIYMGVASLPEATAQLIAHGLSAQTPAAVVSKGTTPAQTVLTGTLDNLATRAAEAKPQAPALVIIGSVVSLRSTLDWYTSADEQSPSQVRSEFGG